MVAIILVLAVLWLILFAVCDVKDSDAKYIFIFLCMIFFLVGGILLGEHGGAYNQMRGKYRITYEIDNSGKVIDTIIHFNKKK